MSTFFIRPQDNITNVHAFIYPDAKILSDNWARIYSMVNGNLTAVNLSRSQTGTNSKIAEAIVKWSAGAGNQIPAVGTRHNHDGWGSALLRRESIPFSKIGGDFTIEDTDPKNFGILFSGFDKYSVVVHFGTIHFDSFPYTSSSTYTQSVRHGPFYKVIAIPFNWQKWGGTTHGYIPANTSGFARVFTQIRGGIQNMYHTLPILSEIRCSSFVWSTLTDGGTTAIKDVTLFVCYTKQFGTLYDINIDWVVVTGTGD